MRDPVPPDTRPAGAEGERRAAEARDEIAPAVPPAAAAAAAAEGRLAAASKMLGPGTLSLDGGAEVQAPEPSAHASEAPSHPGVPLSPPGIVPESDVRVHSPAAAQPHHHPRPWSEDLGELPTGYGDGRLVALLRDPRTIFVYWDLSQQQLEQSWQGLGAGRAVLKLWAAPQGGEFLREVEVNLESRGWYLRDLPPGLEVRIELWAVGERGARLIRAARSLRLPPSEQSSVQDEIYVSMNAARPLGRGEQLSGGQPLHWRSSPQEAAPAQPVYLGSSERKGAGERLGGGSASGRVPREKDPQ